MSIPNSCRAVELTAYDGRSFSVVERPVRPPDPGEVVVRMHAAPINPSDLMMLEGRYGVRKPLPCVPGWEGAGTVVAAGSGLMARLLVGRRVAAVAPDGADGTWSEYLTTLANRVVPLLPFIDDERGATSLLNPVSALFMVEAARAAGHRVVAHTASASQVGRLLQRIAPRAGLEILHIVRRSAQVELLRSLGAQHVFDSSAPDFAAALPATFRRLGVRLAYDAVGGESTVRLLDALPAGGRVTIYGDLTAAPIVTTAHPFLFERKTVDGFWLADHLDRLSLVNAARFGLKAQRLIRAQPTAVAARVPLADAPAAVDRYRRQMSDGKVLLVN